MTRFRVVILAVAAMLAATARRSVAQQPPELSEYSVLGIERVTLKPGARVVSGAVGAVDGTVTLKRAARVAGAVAAGTLELAPETKIGRVFCGIVVGRRPLPSCIAPPTPLVDPALLPPVAVIPGGDDLVVPRRTGIAPVPAGSFDEVVVGHGSLLTLSGGDYAARSIRIAARGQLICSEACRIGIVESVSLGPGAELGARSGLAPQNVRVDVAGGDDPPAFRGRDGSTVTGTVYAPAGLVRLGARGRYRGAFVGTVVVVGPEAQVRSGSAL
jgi:hypothetical protein